MVFKLLFAVFTTSLWLNAQEVEIEVMPKIKKLGADLSLSQNIGSGLISKDLFQERSLSTSLTISPFWRITPWGEEKPIKITGEIATDFQWLKEEKKAWHESFNLSDACLKSTFKNLLSAKNWGLGFSPSAKVEFPTSNGSQKLNRLLGLGLETAFSFSQWGFSLAFKPGLEGYIYSEEKPNQSIYAIKNTLALGYAIKNHSLTVGVKINFNNLRMEDNYNTKLTSAGIVEYGYKLPTDIPISALLGISSVNKFYDMKQGFKWPFFSNIDKKNRLSSIYASIDLTI